MKRLGVQNKGRTATPSPSPTQPKVRADGVLLTVAVGPDGQEIDRDRGRIAADPSHTTVACRSALGGSS